MYLCNWYQTIKYLEKQLQQRYLKLRNLLRISNSLHNLLWFKRPIKIFYRIQRNAKKRHKTKNRLSRDYTKLYYTKDDNVNSLFGVVVDNYIWAIYNRDVTWWRRQKFLAEFFWTFCQILWTQKITPVSCAPQWDFID